MLEHNMHHKHISRRAFSLIELVIVVVIIGIIGAIAIPRMSRGAAGAADSGLVADLAVMRNAIDLYQAEHGGSYPSFANFVDQMTTYTDVLGNTQATKDSTYYLGPYLRSIPELKVGSNKGKNGIVATQGGTTAGWVYDETTGAISANLPGTETDARGVAYNSY
ncbi:MAG: prepilin-type N-terminal cleavage/methylation domain-containing protein [Planctomycetota bacterium]|nr:MAG: prepilin-type N-terminal cleavage/methylation domain-containing protein [Planctomycetota bacterium]